MILQHGHEWHGPIYTVEMKYNFLPIDIESSGSFAIDSSGIRSRPNVFKIAVASLK